MTKIESTINETKEIIVRPRPMRIGIAARLGSGKTTFMRGLEEILPEALFIDEDFKNNPHLVNAYSHPKEYSFLSQDWAFDRKKEQLKAIDNNFAVFVPLLIDKAYAKTYYKMGFISEENWQTYLYNYDLAISLGEIPQPDVILKLEIEDKALKERIFSRGRGFEKGVTDEFLRTLEELMKECIGESGIPVIPIDVQYQDVRDLKKMGEIIEGIEYQIYQKLKNKFEGPSPELTMPTKKGKIL